MQHIIRLIATVFWLALTSAAPASASTAGAPDDDASRHCHMVLDDAAGKPQAMLGNADHLARICCQRPERIVPAQGRTTSMRSPSRQNHLFNLQKTLFCQFRGTHSVPSSRLLAVPASDYYVVMLRHLLC